MSEKKLRSRRSYLAATGHVPPRLDREIEHASLITGTSDVKMEGSLLAGLNPAQRAAVTSRSSVLQVLAPPGSGKTKTLTTRVAYLLAHHGYNPQNVICCTFTIKAAREMRERLRGLVGCELEANLVLGTFHSICRRYLVAYGQLIGIRKGFGIADTSDTRSIVKKICKKGGYTIDPNTARNRISSHKAKNKKVTDIKPSKTPEHQEFRQIYEEYEVALATSNLLDYDDLLLRCLDLLQAHPTCVSNIEAVLIDEFQDTNIVQFELMKLFARCKRRITIVGDPDQSIYGFRAAELENLVKMRTWHPETIVINLEENYRSSSAVLKLAQDVIEQDTDRPDKKLKSTHCYGTLPVLRKLPNPHEEALWITAEIKRTMALTGSLLQHSDIAILIRSGYLSLLIEKSLTSAGIPYRMVGGMRFFDRAEIRLIIDYMRTVSHPDNDSAFLSIINVPSRKIGDATITSFVKLAEQESLPVWQVVQKVLAGRLKPDKKLSSPSEQNLQKLVNIINEARKKMTRTSPIDVPSVLIDFLVTKLCLPAYLQKKYKEDFEDRLENIQEFLTHAKDVAAVSPDVLLPVVDGVQQQKGDGAQESLDQFLANVVLSSEVENIEKSDEKPRVTISTIHSAKGLEWPVVFVPAVYDGSLPHSRAEDVDEERRLFYVAMTRAQALLTLTFPVNQSRDQGQSTLTPFLPQGIHNRLAERGPWFCDEVVADITTILRRQMPSQGDLTKGLQSLGDKGSPEDSIWPTDGSHRPAPDMQSLQPVPGMSLQDALRWNGTTYQAVSTSASTAALSWESKYGASITMSDTASFSTANMSLGFTTASYQLKNGPVAPVPTLTHASSDPEPERKKPKLEKTKSAQGIIASFFAKPKTLTAPETPAEEARVHWKSMRPPKVETSLSHLAMTKRLESVPSELSAHRLTSSSNNRPHSNQVYDPTPSNSAAFKRPRPALEPTSPNRNTKRNYVFLSSLPLPEEKDVGKLGELIHIDDGDDENNVSPPVAANHERGGAAKSSLVVLKSQSQATYGANGVNGVKKSLGVRRAPGMGGWENRKNR